MEASEVVEGLFARYKAKNPNALAPEWSGLTEFSLRPGAANQRIDVMFVRGWSGRPKGFERHAVEVKVSRQDLLSELAQPHKREPFERISHRFFLATPPGLVRDGELPDGVGLYEVRRLGNGELRTTLKVRAPRRDPDRVDEATFVEAFRRAGRAEGRLRMGAAATAGGQGPSGDPEADLGAALAGAVKERQRAEAARDRAKMSLARERQRVGDLARIISHAVVPLCQRCAQPLVVKRSSRWVEWDHAIPTEDCLAAYPNHDEIAERFAGAPIDADLPVDGDPVGS